MGFIIENVTSSYTSISNTFIEEYMPYANGEYVKVYIYLMKCANDSDFSASICTIADVLDIMEKDVIRAFKYWEKAGLLKLTFDENKMLSSLTINNCPSTGSANKGVAANVNASNAAGNTLASAPTKASERNIASPNLKLVESTAVPKESSSYAKEVAKRMDIPAKKTYTRHQISEFAKNDDDLEQLFHIAETYLAHPLSQTDSNTLLYIYDELKFSSEMIDYLIGHCVDNAHKSIHYIESVAVAWAEQGISTLEEAKEHTRHYKKQGASIMKAFGLTGRTIAPSEHTFILKWTNEYGFNIDIILEACNKTIMATHGANFAYTDKILSSWKEKGVSSLDDIKKIDEEFKNSKLKPNDTLTKAETGKATRKQSKNDFNSFPQHTYDFDSLEKALLNN